MTPVVLIEPHGLRPVWIVDRSALHGNAVTHSKPPRRADVHDHWPGGKRYAIQPARQGMERDGAPRYSGEPCQESEHFLDPWRSPRGPTRCYLLIAGLADHCHARHSTVPRFLADVTDPRIRSRLANQESSEGRVSMHLRHAMVWNFQDHALPMAHGLNEDTDLKQHFTDAYTQTAPPRATKRQEREMAQPVPQERCGGSQAGQSSDLSSDFGKQRDGRGDHSYESAADPIAQPTNVLLRLQADFAGLVPDRQQQHY